MEHSGHGISAKYANIVMAAIILVISALLIVATYRAMAGYSDMRAMTDHYNDVTAGGGTGNDGFQAKQDL